MKTLEQLIKDANFNYVSSIYNETNFPRPEKIATKGIKFIRPGKSFTSEEALEMIKKAGGRPANAWELLANIDEIKKELKSYEWCLGFGQTPLLDGYHRVPYIDRNSDDAFRFDYGRLEYPWDDNDVLALFCDLGNQPSDAVTTDSDTRPLDTSPDTKAIVEAIDRLTKAVEKASAIEISGKPYKKSKKVVGLKRKATKK